MDKKIIRAIGLTLLAITTLLIIYKLTSITIPELAKDTPDVSNITGIITAWTSIAALLGAIIAYQRWLQNKIRDDAYELIKKYVAYMSDLEYEVTDTFTRLDSLCPQPGMPSITKKEALDAVSEISDKTSALDKSIRLFHTAKLELEHWDIKLTTRGVELHDETMKGAWNFAVTFHTSLNATGNFYSNIDNQNISADLSDKLSKHIFSENRNFKQCAQTIRETFNKRRSTKFKKLFEINA